MPDDPLQPDRSFTFSMYPSWQFWRRGSGLAEVIATEPDLGIVHLRVIGVGPCVIAHMPIVEAQVRRSIRGPSRPAPGVPSKDLVCRNAVAAWRLEHGRDVAGAFSISIGKAIGLIYEVAADADDDVYIETAYPVRDAKGRFHAVRVITAPAE